MDDRAAELARRNEEAFRRRQPHIWTFLEKLDRHSKLMVDDVGRPVNILVEGTPLYPAPAPDWTAAQLEEYFSDPDRLILDSISYCNLSHIAQQLRREISGYISRHELRLARQPLREIGFAFVFGLGLGYHLAPLLERTRCRRLILIEPVPEFIFHSFTVVDWEALFDRMAAGELEITFSFDPDPTGAIYVVENALSRARPTFLDGSYAYVHYYSWQLLRARTLLNEKIKVHYISSGFFEDEILMMRNTYLNLRRWDFRLVGCRPMRRQTMPVFVVGSGPSLDETLPHLQRWRDHAIVVSCGTALGILLKHGIRPDFHVENENTQPLVNNLRAFHADHGLQGIRLLASTTVPPDVGGLFDERFYYFRSHLSSSYLLTADAQPITWAAPLVANAAVAAMTTMGFHDFTLFGVDCGRPRDASHHAASAVYHDEDYDNYAPGESYEMLENGFDREVPGNFGGTVLTTWYLDMSRTAFGGLIRSDPITVFNCCRGARIDGARPKAASSIRLDNPPNRQAAVIADVAVQLSSFAAGRYLDKIDLAGLADGAAAFADAWTAIVAEVVDGEPSFWTLERRIQQFSNEAFDRHKAVFAIAHSAMRSMIRLGAFGGTRLDEAASAPYFDFFIRHYDATVREMAIRTATMMKEMADGREDLSETSGVTPTSCG